MAPGDQSAVQDCALPTVHGGQWMSIWGELQLCSWTWRGGIPNFPLNSLFNSLVLSTQVFFTGAQRADEPGSSKPKLQGVSVQVLYDHGGM